MIVMRSNPSTENVLSVTRAGFILQGLTFKGWCRSNGIDPGYAHHVVTGKTNGPKAKELRARVVAASNGSAA